MSTPDLPPTPASPAPTRWHWTEADLEALQRSDLWLSMKAPPELVRQYEGMHVALVGEEIIDADRDWNALARRIEARGDTIPLSRLLFRYMPTGEEALSRY